MTELYGVFSIIWESEQDFCSKPFFQTNLSSFTSSPWRVRKCFIQSLHIYPIWISHMTVIDTWDSWVWKWQLVVPKSNLAHFRAISKEKSGCSGPCPPLSWASPKNASPSMDFSLSQGCTIPPVDFVSPYVQPAFPLLQTSAVASWPFPGHLREPGSIQSLAIPQGGEGQKLPSPFACSVCPAQMWCHHFGGSGVPIASPGHSPSQAPQEALWFWYTPTTPRPPDPGKHLPLCDSKGIWVPKCWSLPPLLCDLQGFTKSGRSNSTPWSRSLFHPSSLHCSSPKEEQRRWQINSRKTEELKICFIFSAVFYNIFYFSFEIKLSNFQVNLGMKY